MRKCQRQAAGTEYPDVVGREALGLVEIGQPLFILLLQAGPKRQRLYAGGAPD